jgi:uncharacterized protein
LIVLDANILIYAYQASSPFHRPAKAVLEGLFSGTETVGLPWSSIGAFVRIVTNRRLPVWCTAEVAAGVVDTWLAQPAVHALTPGDGYWTVLRRLLIEGQAPGALFSDAQLAALTIEYGAELYTTDRDFARFPGLRCKNPLA